MLHTIQRRPQVLASNGLSKSTLYKRVQLGTYTPPIKLGERAVGWPSNEVEALNAARIAGKSDDEIRALVKTLVAARKCAA